MKITRPCTRCGEGLNFGRASEPVPAFISASQAFVKQQTASQGNSNSPITDIASAQVRVGDTGTSSLMP